MPLTNKLDQQRAYYKMLFDKRFSNQYYIQQNELFTIKLRIHNNTYQAQLPTGIKILKLNNATQLIVIIFKTKQSIIEVIVLIKSMVFGFN